MLWTKKCNFSFNNFQNFHKIVKSILLYKEQREFLNILKLYCKIFFSLHLDEFMLLFPMKLSEEKIFHWKNIDFFLYFNIVLTNLNFIQFIFN